MLEEKYLLYHDAKERDVVKQFFTNPQGINRQKKTFVFSTPSETGTSYFRVFEPMKALYRHFKDEINLIYTECVQPNHLKLADCIVMHRAGNLHSHFLSVVRMWPKTEKRPLIIHDVDDNEYNLPRTHPMAELWYASGKDKMSIQSLKHSDMVTTTTEKLYKTFKNFNKEVYIFRNMFDWDLPQWNLDKAALRREMLADWQPIEDKIVVGWAGLTSHYEDIRRMHAIFKHIHDKHPNTVFILAGMALRDSQVEIEYRDGRPHFKEKEIDDENMKYRNRVKQLYSDLDPKRLKIYDALPLEEYAKFYALFDISFAYVEFNAFNSCKSEIKVIESIHYGCIPIFTNYGGYADFWGSMSPELKIGNIAINGSSPKLWCDAADHWIKNFNKQDTRSYIQRLKTYSDDTYDINKHIGDRFDFYMTRAEEFEEAQINESAKYVDYEGE